MVSENAKILRLDFKVMKIYRSLKRFWCLLDSAWYYSRYGYLSFFGSENVVFSGFKIGVGNSAAFALRIVKSFIYQLVGFQYLITMMAMWHILTIHLLMMKANQK